MIIFRILNVSIPSLALISMCVSLVNFLGKVLFILKTIWPRLPYKAIQIKEILSLARDRHFFVDSF